MANALEEGGRIHDNWPQHSIGCEMYTPREKKKE